MPDEPQTPTQSSSFGPSPTGKAYPQGGVPPIPLTQGGGVGVQKEQEPVMPSETGPIEEVVGDVEVAPELEKLGVEKRSETIKLPPDVRKMGVEAVGPTQPSTSTTTVPLPLTDDQIVVGLHAQIISSLRWLAEWCIRQLKKAHYHIKVIAGHAVRERD